jgi:hypothetical protein
MFRIVFRYKDKMSKGEWRTQECTVSSLVEAKKIYGLDTDPSIEEYQILEVQKLQ